MLENKKFMGDYYSRFIASWLNGGGYNKYGFGREFKEWLKTLEFYDCPLISTWTEKGWVTKTEPEGIEPIKMPNEVIEEIVQLATCGICEFESWCRTWINQEHDLLEDYNEEIKPVKIGKITGMIFKLIQYFKKS